MSSSRSSIIFGLYLLLSFLIRADADLCLLCEDGVSGLKRPNHFLDSHGSTCTTKSLELATEYQGGSSQCSAQINAYRNCCCSSNANCGEVAQQPTAPPVYTGPTGNYPSCDICKGRGPVTNRAMVINMLYIGTGTCVQYYDYGLAGLIQTHMCDPLQHYAYEPCGCGEYGNVWQAPEADNNDNSNTDSNNNSNTDSNNSSNNNNNDNNNNGSSNGDGDGDSVIVDYSIPLRKNPTYNDDKNNMKYGNGRGGSSGGNRNLKRLKGN